MKLFDLKLDFPAFFLRNKFSLTLIFLFLMSSIFAQKTLYFNAKVYTVDKNFSIYKAFVTENGKILALGSTQKLKDKFPKAKQIDLKGKFVYPGFYDSHSHFYWLGKAQTQADLSDCASMKEIVKVLKIHQKKFPSVWLIGNLWDEHKWKISEIISHHALTNAFPDVPVYLRRHDYHAALVNKKAIETSGILNQNLSEKAKNELKTGYITDELLGFFEKKLPKLSQKEKVVALKTAQDTCFAYGITSVNDAFLDIETALLIDSLQKDASLSIKLNIFLKNETKSLEFFEKHGKYITPKLRIAAIKLFADGALGSGGAALIEPYTNNPLNSGQLFLKSDKLDSILDFALKYDLQVATHCIGDAATRQILNAYAKKLSLNNQKRWRIEHAQVVYPEDFILFGQYDVIPAVQPIHALSDLHFAKNKLGENRIQYAYTWKKLLENAETLCFGSDFPIEKVNPLLSFYASLASEDLKGNPLPQYYLENTVDRETALKAMTIWSAYANFEEETKGSLEPGKCADFVILNQDILTVSTKKIPKTKVLQTYVDGKLVFANGDY